MRKDQILARDIENMQTNFLGSKIFSNQERNVINEQLMGGDLNSLETPPASKQLKPNNVNISEEFIIS